jgi:hypothetical protein
VVDFYVRGAAAQRGKMRFSRRNNYVTQFTVYPLTERGSHDYISVLYAVSSFQRLFVEPITAKAYCRRIGLEPAAGAARAVLRVQPSLSSSPVRERTVKTGRRKP